MINYIRKLINAKKIGILGFGREGRSTLEVLLKAGDFQSITVFDSKDVSKDLPMGIKSVCGDEYLNRLDDCEIIFKSPGVVLLKEISQYKAEFLSQTEIFIRVYRDQIIGITGTKGKSTTSSLLYHVLKECGKDVLFAGNIGIPVFDIYESITKNSIIVVELSCHQLEYAVTSPKRAVILNLYEDHLDHYGTREKYVAAKKNIYRFQETSDTLYTSKETLPEIGEVPGKLVALGHEDTFVPDFSILPKVKLVGKHNLLNASFVYEIVSEYGISKEEFISALESFEPLKHRLSLVSHLNGVDYYDDSISTTVKSTISAVESIKNASVLLVGGMERNIDYSGLCEYLLDCRLKYVICMYESGKRFYEMFLKACEGKNVNTSAKLVSDLYEAVKLSKTLAKEGEAVLLSPAAASYGYFKNFEERGDKFEEYVKQQVCFSQSVKQ